MFSLIDAIILPELEDIFTEEFFKDFRVDEADTVTTTTPSNVQNQTGTSSTAPLLSNATASVQTCASSSTSPVGSANRILSSPPPPPLNQDIPVPTMSSHPIQSQSTPSSSLTSFIHPPNISSVTALRTITNQAFRTPVMSTPPSVPSHWPVLSGSSVASSGGSLNNSLAAGIPAVASHTVKFPAPTRFDYNVQLVPMEVDTHQTTKVPANPAFPPHSPPGSFRCRWGKKYCAHIFDLHVTSCQFLDHLRKVHGLVTHSFRVDGGLDRRRTSKVPVTCVWVGCRARKPILATGLADHVKTSKDSHVREL